MIHSKHTRSLTQLSAEQSCQPGVHGALLSWSSSRDCWFCGYFINLLKGKKLNNVCIKFDVHVFHTFVDIFFAGFFPLYVGFMLKRTSVAFTQCHVVLSRKAWCWANTICFLPGYPGPHNQAPYPMAQPGSMVAPYPSAPAAYGDPSQAPPPGFNMGYNQGPPPVMYQPGPVSGPEYGNHPGAISPAPAGVPAAAAVPVGVPPGLEYLTQVGQRNARKLKIK